MVIFFLVGIDRIIVNMILAQWSSIGSLIEGPRFELHPPHCLHMYFDLFEYPYPNAYITLRF